MKTKLEELFQSVGIDPEKLSQKVAGDSGFADMLSSFLGTAYPELIMESNQIIFPTAVTKIVDLRMFQWKTYYPARDYPTIFPETLFETLSKERFQNSSLSAIPVPRSGVTYGSVLQQVKRTRLLNTDMLRGLIHALCNERIPGDTSWIICGNPAPIENVFRGIPEHTEVTESSALLSRLQRLAAWHKLIQEKGFQIPSLLEFLFLSELAEESLLEKGYYITRTLLSETRLCATEETLRLTEKHIQENLIAMVIVEKKGSHGIDIVPIIEMPRKFFLLPIVKQPS